jgi:hypothetical protein
MNERSISRERQIWIATVAVLATSLSWLSGLTLSLWVTAHGDGLSTARVVCRALFKAASGVAADPRVFGAALALAALAVLGVLLSGLGTVRRKEHSG